MAQSNFEERIDTYEIESTNVMTGDRDRIRYLYYQLKMSMAKAKQIDIIVSFLMESGVRMLLNDMKRALDRGVRIRILTGNYLGITQPSALYLIKSELGDRVDLRLYNETSRSFHPKSYIFHYGSSNEIYIGSSNISKSALTSGIEWNYRFSDTLDKKNYELFYATFEDLFLNHSIIINDEELKRYSKAWKKPAVSRDLAKYDATEDGEDRNTENVRMLYRPRGAQIEALYALQEEELLNQCKNKLFDDSIGKLLEAVESILRQKSKCVASKMPYFIPVSGEYDNSLELRGNLVKSLCWVKKNLSELSQCNQEKIENNIYTLVSTLLQDAKWITWTSLRDCLQNLAELSPEAFLKEAERGIINNPTEIVNLFPPKSGELSGINYISNLLWALEILAWSPEYLVHSISVLGLLEALPYERTNWTNTPINSIVSILLPWYPQTMADLEKRKNALKCLKTDNPRVFWSTLKKLLPNKTRSTSGNPRPKYLKLEIPEEVKVTNAEAHECYVYLVELAVDTARNENEKLVELIDQLGYMYEPTLTDYLECLENSFEFGTDENTFEVWLKLRECMARIEPTEGKVIYKHLDRIQQLIEKMEPTDIRVKHREWYLGNRYLFDKGNYANRWKMLEDKKLSAVKEIFDEYGSEEVERFGSAVKNVHDVANKLGHFLKPKEMSSIIEKCFIGILSKEFTINCLISFVYTQGAEKLLETSLCQMEDEFMLEILSKIPFSLQLLDVINQVLDDDTAYWEKGAMPYSCYDAEELKIIVEKLVVCKRYVTAVNIIGHSECEAVINAGCIYKLMKLAGTEESIGVETLDDYAVQKIIGWFQQQEDIDLELRSDIEFIYLPMLDDYSEVRPRALNTRLSLEPEYFCSLHHFRRHIFRGCGRAGDQSGHHASSNRVADRVHPAAWPGTSKSREQRICRCIGFHRKLSE